jgi:hypothetical protein
MTLLTKLRRFCVLGVTVAAAFIAVAPSALAQPAKIDVYEHRTSPAPHLYIHGRLGDADFQMALPDSWNGKLLIGARGFSATSWRRGPLRPWGSKKGTPMR